MVRQLMADWLISKEAEKEWNEKRLSIEVELYKAVMGKVEINKDGTTRFEDDGMKLTITSGYSYSVDQLLAAENPELFNVKYEHSKTKLKTMSGEAIGLVQHIVTCKPSKPSFKVEVL